MDIISEIIQASSKGILSIYENKITFVLFIGFLLWASINDLKTMKIKDYQNYSFLIVGVMLFGLSNAHLWDSGFTLGQYHLVGAVVGFLLLFIPGMILNYAYGGDIKFAAAMGFWVGPTAILNILIIAVLIQLIILITRCIIQKYLDMKNNFPFAPALSIGYIISLLIILIV